MLKKIIYFLVIFMLLLSVTGSAFYFPQPDWAELYYEREAMVTETDFELYAEGSADDVSVYYGAKFEPETGVYIGTIPQFESSLIPTSSYLTYIADMYESDMYYPANALIPRDNVISMIGWTIYDMNTVNLDQVRRVLDNLSSYNKPMFIRFANEMNCSNLGDDPDLYVEVFRKVADMIHEYPNFAVVWSPNDLGALDRPFEYFYPGDEYVDWVGVSCYMVKYFQGNPNSDPKSSVYFMTGDNSWATNKIKPVMEFLEKNNIEKPVMLSESGVATNSVYGEEYEDWNKPRMRNLFYNLVMKYPRIKMINYFDVFRANENERFNIENEQVYPYAIEIFNEAKNSGAFIREYGQMPDFTYKSASLNPVVTAKENVARLYTLAHIPNTPELSVTYKIDGEWFHVADTIPYTCYIEMDSLSDGVHTIEISAGGISKEYSFVKDNDELRFGETDYVPKPVDDSIKVTVDGDRVQFDQLPVIENGRTLVPLRAIFEKFGAEIKWDDVTQTVTANRWGVEISLSIGSSEMHINDEVKTLDVPAQLIGGRTMVPVRAISEAFGCGVKWIEDTKTVVITSY